MQALYFGPARRLAPNLLSATLKLLSDEGVPRVAQRAPLVWLPKAPTLLPLSAMVSTASRPSQASTCRLQYMSCKVKFFRSHQRRALAHPAKNTMAQLAQLTPVVVLAG